MNKIPVINQIIKDKRKEKKITQSEFSKIINKSVGTVKRYDTGDLIPENTLILICDKLNLDLKNILLEQKIINTKNNENFYIDIIKKYENPPEISDFFKNFIDVIDTNSDNDTFHEMEKELLKEKIEETGENLASLYNMLYSNFYDDLQAETFQRWDLKSKKYTYVPDRENGKIIIKEICTYGLNETEEKVIDIFKLKNIDDMFNSLKEFFNIKIVAMRKYKLRQDKFDNSLTVKKRKKYTLSHELGHIILAKDKNNSDD